MHLNQLNCKRLRKNVKIDGDPFAIGKTDFNVSLILRALLGYIFRFRFFEISGNILRNQKILYV